MLQRRFFSRVTLAHIRRLGWITVAFVYALVVIGGIVRITGSGLGCPDWPTCHGSLIPPLDLHTDIEYSHRLTASIVSTLTVVVALSIFLWARQRRYIIPTLIAVGLLIAQIILGAITVLYELPQTIVTAHLGTALAFFAMMIVISGLLGKKQPVAGSYRSARRFAGVALTGAILTYGLLLSGSNVRGTGADLVCPGWPLCGRDVIPDSAAPLVFVNLFHRTIASIVGLFLIGLIIYAWRRRRKAPKQARLAIIAGILFVIQSGVGAAIVLLGSANNTDGYQFSQGFHLAFGAAVWGCLVGLTVLAYRDLPANPQPEPSAVSAAPEREWVRGSVGEDQPAKEAPREMSAPKMYISAYINLLKPHVTVMLLGVTLAAMEMAQGGLPPVGLILATLFGGACAAGSANAINCYLDRDIDQLMSRTSRRSLPAGRVPPVHALILGCLLAVLSFTSLTVFVNLLSALLALSGILFYVFIYTLWLKRTSTQNIVIGGAAGAVPPLVGWAAVTHSVGLPAILLFAIIFLWTPPHFWALALLIKNDYARARVPMLPVVKGDKETKRQIFIYSLVLLATTLILFVIHALGLIYLTAALVLGGVFIYLAIRVWRDETKRWARTLFWYSNCYLALLFALMVIDRVIIG
jgi:protoheme IX farnesyltransferase